MITAKVKVAPQGGLKFGDIDPFTWFICVDDWDDFLFLKVDNEMAVGFYPYGESAGQEFYFGADDPVRPATRVNIEAEVE